jgi:hypothetical protein
MGFEDANRTDGLLSTRSAFLFREGVGRKSRRGHSCRIRVTCLRAGFEPSWNGPIALLQDARHLNRSSNGLFSDPVESQTLSDMKPPHEAAQIRRDLPVYRSRIGSAPTSWPYRLTLYARLARGSLRTPWRRRKAYRNLA